MGMNPETNRFEVLEENIKEKIDNLRKGFSLEELKAGLEIVRSVLVSPNGKSVPAHWSVFKIDEFVVIKNYTFRVAYIGETAILFEPVGVPNLAEGKTL